jgi:hypothetical protein
MKSYLKLFFILLSIEFISLKSTSQPCTCSGPLDSFIVPFFIEKFGEPVKLDKVWYAKLDFGTGNQQEIKMDIKKMGYKINGELEFIAGKNKGKKYFLKGRFQSLILTFHYYPQDKKSISQGAATLKSLNDVGLLEGHFAYYSQTKDIIGTVKASFHPIKE